MINTMFNGIDTSMKMIQMLQIQEHTATIFSAVIVCHVKHFRTDNLLERIIKYVTKTINLFHRVIF